MKYIVLYEDFFSIFPANRYDTITDVDNEIHNIMEKIIKYERYYNIKKGEYGGWTIHNYDHFFNYKITNLDIHKQLITMEVSEGKLLLSTLTFDSRELKKTLMSDIKNRLNIQ